MSVSLRLPEHCVPLPVSFYNEIWCIHVATGDLLLSMRCIMSYECVVLLVDRALQI